MRSPGPLQPEVLNQAWALALQRFEMLRAGFDDQTRRGRPNVFICETAQAPIAMDDYRYRASLSGGTDGGAAGPERRPRLSWMRRR